MPAITFGWENYCSPSGNDITGDGSIGNPYQTLARCLLELSGQSQTVAHPYGYFILRTWMRAGTYAENVISASQPYPGDPTSTIATGFESVQIAAYPGETVILQPASGVNVVNLTVNTPTGLPPGKLVGACCFNTWQNITIDAVNVSGAAFVVGDASHNNNFIQCSIINSPSDGFQFGGSTTHNAVKQCDVSLNAGNGVVDNGTDNTVQDSLCHDNATSGIVANGTQTGTNPSTGQLAAIERNRCYANLDGITSSAGSLVKNNLSYTNTSDGISATDGKIYNNTCYGNTAKGVNASNPADVQNNICFGNGTNAIGIGNNNLDTGADPLFVDAAAANFHILTGSPAINAGASLLAVQFDFDLRGRPQNGILWDIGAYEYIAPGATVTITTIASHFAIGVGRAPEAPMVYRTMQATLKAFTGTPKVGIALCVDPASTPSSFTGYVWLIDFSEGHGVSDSPFQLLKYVNQPLTALGTLLARNNWIAPYSDLLSTVFHLTVGTNTLVANSSIWSTVYNVATNNFAADSAISRSNYGLGVVGIGNTVSIVLNGDDLEITTEDGTVTFTLLQGGGQNNVAPTIVAFDETFTFHTPVSYNKSALTGNYGIVSEVDVDIKCHCQGNDCPGLFFNSCFDYLEINAQGEDNFGDGLEIEVCYNGIVSGTPRTGVNLFLFSGFTSALFPARMYGIIIDEIDKTIKLVRWDNQPITGYGTVLTEVSFAPNTKFSMLIWLINSGSIRAAGDPAEWFVWIDPTQAGSYGSPIIDDFIDTTAYGQIVESPNELLKWKNTRMGLSAIGTNSGNTADVANWRNLTGIAYGLYMAQLL